VCVILKLQVHTFFKDAFIQVDICKIYCNNREIIHTTLLVKVLFRYLDHLDSLGVRHATDW
jgi:hypothetical protein